MATHTLSILKPSVNNLTTRIFLRAAGLDFDEVDVWGKKRMVYTVGKFREGHFVHTRFTIDPQKLEEIRRAAALSEDVLRATITNAVGKLPETKAEAPAQAPPADASASEPSVPEPPVPEPPAPPAPPVEA